MVKITTIRGGVKPIIAEAVHAHPEKADVIREELEKIESPVKAINALRKLVEVEVQHHVYTTGSKGGSLSLWRDGSLTRRDEDWTEVPIDDPKLRAMFVRIDGPQPGFGGVKIHRCYTANGHVLRRIEDEVGHIYWDEAQM